MAMSLYRRSQTAEQAMIRTSWLFMRDCVATRFLLDLQLQYLIKNNADVKPPTQHPPIPTVICSSWLHERWLSVDRKHHLLLTLLFLLPAWQLKVKRGLGQEPPAILWVMAEINQQNLRGWRRPLTVSLRRWWTAGNNLLCTVVAVL